MKKIKILTAAAIITITASLAACTTAQPTPAPAASQTTTVTTAVTAEPGATQPDDTDPDITEEEVPYITLPAQTTDISALDGELLGKLGGNDAEAVELTDGNSVFLVTVDPDATKEMINEFIEEYGLGIVYDYENFNMYAVSVPAPLDDDETTRFIEELTDKYSFILTVEPDSVVTLD